MSIEEELERLRKKKRLKELELKFQPAPAQEPESMPVLDQALGALEGAGAMAYNTGVDIASGLAGIGGALNPFAEQGEGERMVDLVQKLRYEPSEKGRAVIAATSGIPGVETALNTYEKIKQTLGDDAIESLDSPLAATMLFTAPDALLQTIGFGVGSKVGKNNVIRPEAKRRSEAEIQATEKQTADTGIGITTTDVFPPESRTGKFFQARGEEVRPGLRAEQQQQRVQAIDDILGEYDIEDMARYEQTIVKGVKESIKGKKKEFSNLYEQSSDALNDYGVVDTSQTRSLANDLLSKQQRLGSAADDGVISDLSPLVNMPDDLTFNEVRLIRSSIGRKLKAAKNQAPVTGSGDVALLSQLYKKLTQDLRKFADDNSPELSDEWKSADTEYAKFAIGSDKTGARNLIKQGDATPEIVDQLLFSKKQSDLDFLNKNLTPESRMAAQQRILQKMLHQATVGGQDLNPLRFQKEGFKLRGQINTFFKGEKREALVSLMEILKKTGRAQEAGVLPPTGVNLVGILNIADPRTLLPGMIQSMIETKPIRNLLIKRKNAKTVSEQIALDKALSDEMQKAGLTGALLTSSALNTGNK